MPENTVTDEFHSLAVTPNTESNLPWREYARQRYSQLQGRMAGSQGKVNAADTAGVQNTVAVGTATATQDGPVQNATPFPIHDSTQEMATENTVPLPIAGDSDPRVESLVFGDSDPRMTAREQSLLQGDTPPQMGGQRAECANGVAATAAADRRRADSQKPAISNPGGEPVCE